NTDVSMLTQRWVMLFCLWLPFTSNKGIPMPIGSMNEINRLRFAFQWTVQFDLEGLADLRRNNEMFVIFMQIAILAILAQLDTMPAIGLLEARKPHIRKTRLFGSKIPFESFGESI